MDVPSPPPWPVAALYVDPAGPYGRIAVEVFDAERDARTYTGDLPVVAHPPCGPWGRLSAFCKNQDRSLGIHAVEQVRRVGGVLEHPIGSKLFKECGIPTSPWTPDRELDAYGGYTIRIPLWHWGHLGEKDTVLYICPRPGCDPVEFLPPLPDRQCETAPRPVQNLSKGQRRLTPPAMAWWLCSVAVRCG